MKRRKKRERESAVLRRDPEERTLFVGYRAADLTPACVAGRAVCHALDLYQAHQIEKAFPAASVVCGARLPEGPWDRVFFRTGPKLMSGELALDLLQEIHLLSPAAFMLDYAGRESERNALLDKVRGDPGRVRSFRAEWPASVPGGEPMTFASYPGCFCHRRLDEGGLALAEVVCRDWTPPADRPARFLDMGCGCGLVGFLVAGFFRSSGKIPPALTMVDSHARAVAAARENAAAFALEADVRLADDGLDGRPGDFGTYDAFAGNPPYYSDYRIADVFLETAAKALRPGGACYSVCKNAAGLEPVQRRYFPSVEIIPRRGYAVLKSVKE